VTKSKKEDPPGGPLFDEICGAEAGHNFKATTKKMIVFASFLRVSL